MTKIRLLQDEDFAEYTRLTLEAYPSMITDVSDEERKAWIGRMQKEQAKKGKLHYWGAFREGKLAGAMRLHDFNMTVHESRVTAGGVGNIAVELLNKKEHVAKELMEAFHEYYLAEGACMALLWPFRPDFYSKMGYGYGRKFNQYRFKPGNLPRGSKENLRFLNKDDVDAMLDCYDRYAARTHGMIMGSRRYLEAALKRHKVVGYEVDGRLSGFLSFSFKKKNDEHPLLQDIEVSTFIYEDREALKGLLSFLQTQLDQVDEVVYNTQDDDMHFLFSDPRDGTPKMFYTCQQSNIQGVGIMYRVIDTGKLFKALAGHDFNGVSLRVKLNIHDSFLPSNNGATVVHFKQGYPEVADEGSDVEVSMDVAWFSSLVMGVVGFEKLWTYGLADVSDESLVPLLDRLFWSPKPPQTIEEF